MNKGEDYFRSALVVAERTSWVQISKKSKLVTSVEKLRTTLI